MKSQHIISFQIYIYTTIGFPAESQCLLNSQSSPFCYLASIICIIILRIIIEENQMFLFLSKILIVTLFLSKTCLNLENFGTNLVINSNLTEPIIFPSLFKNFQMEIMGWKTKRKYVQLIIFKLLKEYFPLFCSTPSKIPLLYSEQYLDTDSTFSNEYYYQTFNLTTNRTFLLSLNYVSQILNNPATSKFRVVWNGKTVAEIAQSSCQTVYKQYRVISQQGSNQLAFEGLGFADSFGVLIRNIQLRQIFIGNASSNYSQVPTQNITVNNTNSESNNASDFNSSSNTTFEAESSIKSNLLKPFASIYQLLNMLQVTSWQQKAAKNVLMELNFAGSSPITSFYQFSGLKKYMKNYVGYLIQFNRLLLFNYHNRNFTITASIIISFVQYMDDMKGVMSDDYIYPHIGLSSDDLYSQFQQGNNFVNTYSPFYPINQVLSQRQSCFMISFADFLFWQLPIALAMFLIGKLCFHLTFKYKISLFFRSFTMLGILFISLMEGKIEVYSFQFVSEVLFINFYGSYKKVLLGSMIHFYFFFFFLASGSMYIFLFLYGKKAKYLFDNCKSSISSTSFSVFCFGIFNILLGFTHRLLRDYPSFQIQTIIILEILSAYFQFFTIYNRLASGYLSANLLLMTTIIRLLFYLTLAVPQYYQEVFSGYLNYAQFLLFQLMILVLVLSALTFITETVKTIFCLLFVPENENQRAMSIKETINDKSIRLKKLTITIKYASQDTSKYNCPTHKKSNSSPHSLLAHESMKIEDQTSVFKKKTKVKENTGRVKF